MDIDEKIKDLYHLLSGDEVGRYADLVNWLCDNVVLGSEYPDLNEYRAAFNEIIDNLDNFTYQDMIGEGNLLVSKATGLLPSMYFVNLFVNRRKLNHIVSEKSIDGYFNPEWIWVTDRKPEGQRVKLKLTRMTHDGSFSEFNVDFLHHLPRFERLEKHFEFDPGKRIVKPLPYLDSIIHCHTLVDGLFLYNSIMRREKNNIFGSSVDVDVKSGNLGYLLFPWTDNPDWIDPFIQEHDAVIGVFPYSFVGKMIKGRYGKYKEIGNIVPSAMNPDMYKFDSDVGYMIGAKYVLFSGEYEREFKELLDDPFQKVQVIGGEM